MTNWMVREISHFSPQDASDLFNNKIAACRIPQYCDLKTCSRLSEDLLKNPNRFNYEVYWSKDNVDTPEKSSTDVYRVGAVDSVVGESSPVDAIWRLRNIAGSGYHPIDKLRLELDEIFPGGAGLYKNPDGTTKLAGVGRIMESSNEIIHADVGRKNCLTANVYLRMPASGGHTKVWNYEGDYLNAKSSYQFRENELPTDTPTTTIEPCEGDLIIWNPMRPHVVSPFGNGVRVTLQSWLFFSTVEGQSRVVILN